ncbi:NADH-ubiquinone oxidoreductase-like protein [Wolffia australiana]
MAARGVSFLLRRAMSANAIGQAPSRRGITAGGALIGEHTAKWMQDTSKKSPMELINEVPPIKVSGRIAVCTGANDASLGHPVEFICLDQDEPAVCKYCGLRFFQDHHH